MSVDGSRAGSKCSGHSKCSSRYKVVCKSSQVDESLFGSQKLEDTKQAMKTTKTKASSRNPMADTVKIRKSDIQRMMEPSPIITIEEQARLRKASDEKRAQGRQQALARKQRMLKMEEETLKHVQPTETQMLQQQENEATKTQAEILIEEQIDEVKHMNKLMLYSQCMTIRDAQVEEKKAQMLEDQEINRKMDLVMEIERIKALENYELRERQRLQERQKGKSVLVAQIKEREQQKLAEEELRDQERQVILSEIERIKQEELKLEEQRKQQAKELLNDVQKANSEQIERKKLMKEREIEEQQKIVEYIKNKERKEQEIAEEKLRIAKEKERETARLRAMQEKIADKQAEEDELRAKRYQEENERKYRMKQQQQIIKQCAMQQELQDAREAQKQLKVRQVAEMVKLEQQEFKRVLVANKQKEEETEQQRQASLQVRLNHKNEIIAQIRAKEEERAKARQLQLEEGRKIKELSQAEKQRLLQIKQKKIKYLKSVGVPEKYMVDLQKFGSGFVQA